MHKLHGSTIGNGDDEKQEPRRHRWPQRNNGNVDKKLPPIQSTVSKFKKYTPPKVVRPPPPGFSRRVFRESGIIHSYDSAKGFGFIRRQNGRNIFVHCSEVNGYKTLLKGERVEFNVGQRNGKERAVNVNIVKNNEAFVHGKCQSLPHGNQRKLWRRR